MTTRISPSALAAVTLIVAVIAVATVGIFYLTVSSKHKSALEQKAQAEHKRRRRYTKSLIRLPHWSNLL